MKRFYFVLAAMAAGGSAFAADVVPTPMPAAPAVAGQPCPPGTMPIPGTPGTVPGTPGDPTVPGAPELAPAPFDRSALFNQQFESGTQPARSFNPNMFGDFPGVTYARPSLYNSYNSSSSSSSRGRSSTQFSDRHANLPLAGRYQGVKITENDTPRPTDKLSFGYNFYDNINSSLNSGPAAGVDLHRQTLSFEKTFLDGNASFGMRLPFVQYEASVPTGNDKVGDLTLVGKYAFYNDALTGDVLSGGLVLTVPTGGGNAVLTDGGPAPHSVLIQPWAGFVANAGDTFVQGFSSLIVPTDGLDPTIWFNSLGLGHWIVRDGGGAVSGIAPVAELHLNTPLNHSSKDEAVYVPHQLNATAGSYFMIRRSIIGLAAGVPLMGPRPYQVEGILTWNLYY